MTMRLIYRAWRLKGPSKTILQQYAHIPMDMLRREPVFIHHDAMKKLIENMDGGKRNQDNVMLVYVKFPGYRPSVMTPDQNHWDSFDQGWEFTRIKDFLIDPLKTGQWLHIIDFRKDGKPLCVSLTAFIGAPNSNSWSDLLSKIRYGQVAPALDCDKILTDRERHDQEDT